MITEKELREALYDFINRCFTKAELKELCRSKGVSAEGNKSFIIEKVLALYSPCELLEYSEVLRRLRWYEKLILYTLLSGAKSKSEIVKHELVSRILAHKIPEAAFGVITSKMLDEKEARRYISRKVDGLRKKHILISEKRGRKLIYSIHPWFLEYFQQNLVKIDEKQILKEAYTFAESSIRFVATHLLAGRFWPEWKKSLHNFRKTIKELIEIIKNQKSKLRFGAHLVPASSIAEQYYCEKKVELAYMFGEVETEDKITGRENHEKLLQETVRIKAEELWAEISSGAPVVVREMFLIGKYGDVFVAGRPDAIYFKDGDAKLVIEYKFTKSRRPWRDYHIQARIYCLLLGLMGFKTHGLKYALVLAPQKMKILTQPLKKVEKLILKNMDKGILEEKINEETIRIFINEFQVEDARQELEWALGYWKGQRDAIPTRNPNKCRICPFKDRCNFRK